MKHLSGPVLSLLMTLALSSSLFAQVNENLETGSRSTPRFILKYSPISHIDLYNPALIQIGLEHRLSDHFYLEHEAGLISAYQNNGSDEDGDQYKWGWRIQEEIRYYYNGAPDWGQFNAYLSGLATWRYSSFDNWVTVSYRDGAYFRNFQANVEDELIAGAVGWGVHLLWDKVVTIDMSAHYGIKYINRRNGIPEDADSFWDDWNGDWLNPFEVRDERKGVGSHFIVSLKIGFIL